MFNRIILVGRLTKDPELRYTPGGTAVCKFRLASTTKISYGSQPKEEKLFIDIDVWGKHGESCNLYLRKGKLVLVEGRLQIDTWQKQGQTMYKTKIVGQTVRFLEKMGEDSPQQPDKEEEPF